ncbi:MAG: hypothetical protein IPK19_20240 [Chloroflexi bacterium]|nr:hypothetical protein [Chloroflexota bacterium]
MAEAVAPAVAGMNGQAGSEVRQQTSIRWRHWGGVLLAFLLGFAAAIVLLSATDALISTDDYYHTRISAELIEQGTLRLDFPWLPLTILSPEAFVDHHLLYHVYLAPFVQWGGIPGAKLAQALVVGGMFAAFWLLLRTLEVRLPWLWLIALLGVSTPFLYRMLMVRTQAAAVLVLFLALYALFSRRYRWLAPIAFAFTWLYNGFILLPVFAGLYVLSAWLTDRQWVWRPLIYTAIGVAAGLVINPYFPQNITFILDHLGEKVDVAANIRVGSEWYPYTTEALLDNSLGMLLALAAGMLAPSLRKTRRDGATGRDRVETTLLLTALVTLYMTFESRRFIEYSPAFALLFCATALGREGIAWDRLLPVFPGRRLVARAFPLMIALPILLLAGWTMTSVRQDIEGVKDADYMAGAAAWLQANTAPGELVFQTDWDDFTYLFYHNTHNIYLVGLDPTYLQVANPTLWNLWVPITQGMVERPSVLIRDSFGASLVVSDTDHVAFAQSAENDPNLELVYRDSYSLIWQIKDAQPES